MKFTVVNLRQPVRLFVLLLSVVITVFFWVACEHDGLSFLFLFVFIIGILVSTGFGLIRQIVIDEWGVHFLGLVGTKRFSWGDIRDTGVVFLNRYDSTQLARTDYDKKILAGLKACYVSAKTDFKPGRVIVFFGDPDTIVFDYRKEAMRLIEYYLLKYKNETPANIIIPS